MGLSVPCGRFRLVGRALLIDPWSSRPVTQPFFPLGERVGIPVGSQAWAEAVWLGRKRLL